MAKGSRKKPAPLADMVVPQCIVADVEKLARRCSQALQRALDSQEVFATRRERGSSVSIYFTDSLKIQAKIRNAETRPVLPLPNTATGWLHVAIDLNFVDRGQWRINHVSIGLLHGEISVEDKKAILRAEWQNHEEADDSGHAQPHWHVLGAAGIEEIEPPSFEESVEVASATQFDSFLAAPQPKDEATRGFSHFHYAMVADWHAMPSQGPCRTLDSEASLVSWLEGCVRYICHQLAHVTRKSGGSAAKVPTFSSR